MIESYLSLKLSRIEDTVRNAASSKSSFLPMSVHGCEKLEISTSLMGPRALSTLSSLDTTPTSIIELLISRSPQKSLDKEEFLRAGNTPIVYRLQFLITSARIAGLYRF